MPPFFEGRGTASAVEGFVEGGGPLRGGGEYTITNVPKAENKIDWRYKNGEVNCKRFVEH